MKRRAVRALVTAGSLTAAAGTLHAALNAVLLRRLPHHPPAITEPVSVLIPARNEAGRIAPCLESVLAQTGIEALQVLVLDDGSTDGTAAVVAAVAAGDARVRILPGRPLPAGRLGKPYACTQLAEAAGGTVLVFLDADVRLSPGAVAASVALLRSARLDLLSPYPRQVALTAAERLVQPLLQWSWLTTLPLRLAERSRRPSLTVANGQLLAVDTAAYRRGGGHGGTADNPHDDVLDDLALARAVKRTGGRAAVADASAVAWCRMYDGWPDVREGYTKSLWSATGSPYAAAGICTALGLAYLLPPIAALAGSRIGAAGYAAAVAGRVLTARRTGGRAFPDALAHPVSIALLGTLTALSWSGRRARTLTWRGRALP